MGGGLRGHGGGKHSDGREGGGVAGRWWDDKAGHCLGRQMAGGFSKAAGIGAEDEEEEEGAQLLSCSHVHLQHGCCFRRIGTFPSMELTPHANPRAQGGKKKKNQSFCDFVP